VPTWCAATGSPPRVSPDPTPSANGAAGHAAWLYNLAAHPDQVEVEFEGRKTPVTPQTLTGEERATAWQRITSERPNFASYETKTDRQIPVVRLTAR
jgi:deazaflavin-dependent oxidoreductase (nitroreductase family)